MNIKALIKKIKTHIIFFSWGLTSLLILPFALLVSYLPYKQRHDSRLYFFITSVYSYLLVFFSRISYNIVNSNKLPTYPENPSIILINHSSMLDIPLIDYLVGTYPHIWIGNDYSKVPLLGRLLRRMHVIVDRRKPMEALRKALRLTKNKNRHLLIFPEGTRHFDGEIHTFHGGFAVFAEKLQRPVIPIVMSGLHKIYPKKSSLIDSSASNVKISIGKPIYYESGMSRQDFIDKVHRWFVEEMKTLKE